MKRALVVLLALVMGAGLLFAADQAPAKWTWYLEGNFLLWDQDGAVGMDGGQYTAYGVTYAETDFGFSALVEPYSDNFVDGASTAGWRNISGWYKLFNNMLKVTVGKDRIGDYRATTYVEGGGAYTRIANAEWGFALQAYPVKGLSAGVFVKFPEAQTAQDYANMLGVGASYSMDLLTFNVVFRTMDSGASPALKENELGVSAVINAVKGLPIMLGYGLSMYDVDAMKHNILFSTKYTMDALSLAVDANFVYQTAAAYAVELEAKYALNKSWTAGVELGYGNESYGDMTLGGFFVWPWLQLSVGSAHTLKLGFVLDTDGDGAGADTLLWNIPFFYSMSF